MVDLIEERHQRPTSGWTMLPASLVLVALGPILVLTGSPLLILAGILCGPLFVVSLFGFQAVQPNNARVLLLFGEYVGTIRESGFFWVNPFYTKKPVSLRVRNFETGSTTTPETKDAAGKVLTHKTRSGGRPSKVNDRDGNPIEISAGAVRAAPNLGCISGRASPECRGGQRDRVPRADGRRRLPLIADRSSAGSARDPSRPQRMADCRPASGAAAVGCQPRRSPAGRVSRPGRSGRGRALGRLPPVQSGPGSHVPRESQDTPRAAR